MERDDNAYNTVINPKPPDGQEEQEEVVAGEEEVVVPPTSNEEQEEEGDLSVARAKDVAGKPSLRNHNLSKPNKASHQQGEPSSSRGLPDSLIPTKGLRENAANKAGATAVRKESEINSSLSRALDINDISTEKRGSKGLRGSKDRAHKAGVVGITDISRKSPDKTSKKWGGLRRKREDFLRPHQTSATNIPNKKGLHNLPPQAIQQTVLSLSDKDEKSDKSKNANSVDDDPHVADAQNITPRIGEAEHIVEEPRYNVVGPNHLRLCEARPITENSQLRLGSAIPVDLDEAQNLQKLRDEKIARDARILRFLIGGGCFVVLFVLIAVVATVLTGDSSETNGKESLAIFPTLAPTESPFIELFPMPDYTRSAIQNWPESAQAKAYEWLKEDLNVKSYEEWRIKQRFALATLYYATGGPNWLNNEDWLSHELDECQWFLVKHERRPTPCTKKATSNAKYVALFLVQNELQGTIPPEIGLLDDLKDIQLSRNSLRGTIPPQFFDLPLLRSLWLNSNRELEGSLPTKIGMLTDLVQIFVGRTKITRTIPSEIGNLSRLEHLNIASTQITGTLPTELGLCNLRNFSFAWLPSLSGTLPTELGRNSDLKGIYGGLTGLGGPLPSELGNLSKLIDLALYENDHTGHLPSELGLLSSKFRELRLTANSFSGSLPSEMGLMSAITHFVVDSNQLTGGIPAEYMNLRLLQKLDVSSNNLSGIIPEGVCYALNSSNLFFDCSSSLCGCDCNCTGAW